MDNLEPIHAVPETETPAAEAQSDIRSLLQSFLTRRESLSARALETETALQSREREIADREMHALVREECEKHGLPAELGDCLSFPDAESARRGVAALEQAFRQAVQRSVEERLSGDTPKTQPVTDTDKLTDAEYYALTGFAM